MTNRPRHTVKWTLSNLQTYIARHFHHDRFYLEFQEGGYDWDQAYTSTEVNGTHFKLFTVKSENNAVNAFTLAARIHEHSEFWPGWRCVLVEPRGGPAHNEMLVYLYGGRYIVRGVSQPCSPPGVETCPELPCYIHRHGEVEGTRLWETEVIFAKKE